MIPVTGTQRQIMNAPIENTLTETTIPITITPN
jgi:hypothetical protein